MATTLLRNVTEEETFLRAVVPAEAPLAVVLHAPEAASSCVLRHLSQLAAERRDLHRKWCAAAAAVCHEGLSRGPGSTAMCSRSESPSRSPSFPSCLPCLSVRLAGAAAGAPLTAPGTADWNAFRLWSHRGAWRGAAQLKLLLHSPLAPEPQPPCTRLGACEPGECCRVPPAWAAQSGARLLVLPCQNLSHLAAAAGEGAAEMEAAAELAERVLGATGLAGRTRERLQAVAS